MTRHHATAAHPLAPRHHRAMHRDTIEWEEMPSLAPRMVPMNLHPAAPQRPVVRSEASDFNSAWGITMPADLDTPAQPTPFRETIRGLATREMDEPELFKHFFG